MFSDPSVETRLEAWKMAWNGFKERPVLGWGQENFIGIYTVNPIRSVDKPVIWSDRAHNIVIHWLINAGLLGLLSYLLIFGYAFYLLFKNFRRSLIKRPEFAVIFTAIAAYFFQNLFTFDTISTYIIYFALLAYIDNLDPVKSGKYFQPKVNVEPVKKGLKTVVTTFIALSIFLVAAFHLHYKPVRESRITQRISTSFPEYESFFAVTDDFNRALSYNTFGDTEVRGIMLSAVSKIIKHGLFTSEGALRLIQRTAEELEEGITDNRHNLRYLSRVIKFYQNIAYREDFFIPKTKALIYDCISKNPEYHWLYFALADMYVFEGDYENAFTAIQNVVSRDPLDDSKQIKLALAAILTGREDVLMRTLENVKKMRSHGSPDLRFDKDTLFSKSEIYSFARTYREIKDYVKALKYYKDLIALSPDEAIYHIEAAKLFLELGDKANALIEAEKASKFDVFNNFTEDINEITGSVND
jgi:tetratricopeptide (TPR) repeat protein